VTGKPPAPLIAPAQAAELLDHVVREQVLECLDLEALYRLEQSLTLLVAELEAAAGDQPAAVAAALVDRALARLPDDVRRFIRAGPGSPFDDGGYCGEPSGLGRHPAGHAAPRPPPARLRG
jgi:hypothetical protein